MSEQERMQVSPGVVLPNGWVCLEEAHFGEEQIDGVVLAHQSQSVQPFATWQVVWTVRDGRWFPRTIAGDYCETIEQAVRSFQDRCQTVASLRG